MYCYCESTPAGIICDVCESEFFGTPVEVVELKEVW